MDHVVFIAQMQALASTYDKDTTQPEWLLKVELYWELFRGWPNERFKAAVQRHVMTGKFFPRPSELREHVQPPKMTAEEAWLWVMDRIEAYGHRSLLAADVPSAIRKACRAVRPERLGLTDFSKLGFIEDQFARAFEAYQIREDYEDDMDQLMPAEEPAQLDYNEDEPN